VAVIGGLFAAAAATALILPQHIAVLMTTMLAFIAPVLGLLVTLAGARTKSDSNDRLLGAARQLARDVRSQEAGVLARLMADSGDPAPAEVSFARSELTYSRADGGDRRGTLRQVKGYYRSLDRGRLVVLGKPGAGKTVLAIQLVLDLAAAVLEVADGTGRLPRVPVRLSLPAFDPGDDVDAATPEGGIRPAGQLAGPASGGDARVAHQGRYHAGGRRVDPCSP
jgi:hypothetical protein